MVQPLFEAQYLLKEIQLLVFIKPQQFSIPDLST